MQISPMMTAPRTYLPATGPVMREPASEGIRLIGVTVHLSRDQEVFGEGEPADQVFKVVRGAVRCFRVLSDGRRQICDFYLRSTAPTSPARAWRWSTPTAGSPTCTSPPT